MAPSRVTDVLLRQAGGTDMCRNVVHLIMGEEDGLLGLQERTRLDVHLTGCGECSIYRRQLHLTIHAIGNIPPPDISSVTKQRLLRKFRIGSSN